MDYVVTAVEPQKSNKKKYNLYLDGEFRCGLTEESVFLFGIKVGQTITEEYLQKILESTETQIAFEKTLNLLSKSMKTKKQIEDYLVQKGFSQITIENVLQKLIRYNYVDDDAYAKAFVAQNKSTKGAFRIKQELFLKGVSKKIVEDALAELNEEDTVDTAFCVAKKFLKNKPLDQKELQRLNRHLLSRGFDFDTVKTVVLKLKDDGGDCTEEDF